MAQDKFNRTRVILPDGSEGLAPDNEVLQGIKQGNWKLPETDLDGNPMEILLKDNQGTFTLKSSELNKNINIAFEDGVSLGGMDDIRKEHEERKQHIIKNAYDDPLSAGVLGAARGATLGLSDAALKMAGYENAVKGLKEENPNASLAGDVIGTVGSVILSGGASLAGKVASKTGAALTAKAGLFAGEKAAAKIAAKYGLKNEVAKKALELGIGSAVEGALYSGGRTLVDETLLGDAKANYGKVMQDALTGGVFGGIVGGTIPVLGQALKAGITKGSDLVSSPKLWDGVRKTYAKAMKLRGGDPKLVEDLFDATKNDQQRIAKYLDSIKSADDDIASEVNQFMMQADDQIKHSNRIREEGLSNSYLDKKIYESKTASSNFRMMNDKIKKTMEEIGEDAFGFEAGTGNMFKSLKSIFDPFKNITQGAQEAINFGGDDLFIPNLRDYARTMHKTRMQADDFLTRYRQLEKMPGGLDELQKQTKRVLEDVRNLADKSLKQYDIFGAAGDKFKLSDKLYSNIIEPYNTINHMGKVDVYQAMGGKLDPSELAVGIEKNRGFNPKLVAKILRNPTETAKSSSLKNAMEIMQTNFKAASQAVQDFIPDTRINENIDRINKLVNIARGVQSLEKQTGRNLSSMLIGGMVGSSVGGVFGGIPGVLAGQALSNPVAVSKALINMEKTIQTFDKKVGAYFKNISVPAKTIPTIKTGINNIIYQMNDTKKGDEKESQKKLLLDINNGSLYEKFDKRIDALSIVAPQHAQMMQTQLQIAKSLISQVIPQGLFDETIKKQEIIDLSQGQVRKINNILVATLAPSAFMDMLNQNQVSPKLMEVFKQAQPDLFLEMQMQATKVASKTELPRQAKLRLQYLFGIPVNNSLRNIGNTQMQLYGQQNTQAQEQQTSSTGGTKLRVKGLDNLERSKEMGSISARFG